MAPRPWRRRLARRRADSPFVSWLSTQRSTSTGGASEKKEPGVNRIERLTKRLAGIAGAELALDLVEAFTVAVGGDAGDELLVEDLRRALASCEVAELSGEGGAVGRTALNTHAKLRVMTARQPESGLLRADDLRPGEPYELDHGRRVYCAPGGGSHAKPNLLGGAVVAFDPKVGEERDAGVDPGFKLKGDVVRAPDVAVGHIPSEPGWVPGAPELAIEYADVGQDEVKLQDKIRQLLAAGTQYLWVVRLVGPRRVEVHERGKAMRTVGPGAELTAPGVLQNPVPVEALYDRGAAERATLTNLLQRKGYQDLDAVLAKGREEGREEGRADGLRAAVRDLCELLNIRLTPERESALAGMDTQELDALRERLKRDRRWD